MVRVHIVEDNVDFAKELKKFLSEKGYEIIISTNTKHAIEFMTKEKCDICILDIGLPDGTGFDLCEMIRSKFIVPILMLTAYESENDIIHGLQCGADDYVTKPCSLNILFTRIQALLRRNNWCKEEGNVLISGDIVFDIDHKSIKINNNLVPMGKTEIDLISALIQSYGQIMPRNILLERIWDVRENYIEDNTLSVHVSRLRNKLGKYNGIAYIETVKGIGYRWNVEVRRR